MKFHEFVSRREFIPDSPIASDLLDEPESPALDYEGYTICFAPPEEPDSAVGFRLILCAEEYVRFGARGLRELELKLYHYAAEEEGWTDLTCCPKLACPPTAEFWCPTCGGKS